MTIRLTALAAGFAALLGALAGGPARTGPFGLEWPDWGQDLELADLRHTLEVHPPAAVERWLYNPRERTARGLRRLETEGPDAALGAFEAAGRLAPGDREVLLNLGTARLLADHGDAVGALERAVTAEAEERPLGPEDLQRAWYNLGAARLAKRDPAGAVAAFEEALRRDPEDADAKFNLELALRRLDDERLRVLPPQESPDGRRPGEEAPSDEPGGTEPEPEPEPDQDQDPGAGRDPEGAGSEAETAPEEGASAAGRTVAGFQAQPDLTAAQAAALLEAVENLERQQRRLEAAEAARASGAAEEEDW